MGKRIKDRGNNTLINGFPPEMKYWDKFNLDLSHLSISDIIILTLENNSLDMVLYNLD